jgi:hypothetical protein
LCIIIFLTSPPYKLKMRVELSEELVNLGDNYIAEK